MLRRSTYLVSVAGQELKRRATFSINALEFMLQLSQMLEYQLGSSVETTSTVTLTIIQSHYVTKYGDAHGRV